MGYAGRLQVKCQPAIDPGLTRLLIMFNRVDPI
jgi:hypothetical protein